MRVLVTGANGLLGHAIQAEMPAFGISLIPLTKHELDVTESAAVVAALERVNPDVVLNCAAYTHVDAAEANEAEAMRINGRAARMLAEACSTRGIRVVYPSTDYVFAGDAASAYLATDEPRPINAYGRSKLAGEQGTRLAADHLIVRTSWLFGMGGPNFVRTIVSRLDSDERLRVVDDQTGRPTFARDLARAISRLLTEKVPSGIYHVANEGVATWFTFAKEIAALFDNAERISACRTEDFPRPAPRPRYSVLDTFATDILIGTLRPWRDALADAVHAKDY